MTNTISYGPFEIEYDYTPGDPGVRYHSDGSGTPPTGSEIDVVSAKWDYSAPKDIEEFLNEFLAPVEMQGDVGQLIRERFEAPDGRVPEVMFDAWFSEHESAVWEEIDDERQHDE